MAKILPIRGCVHCLKGFRPKRLWQRFCGKTCRKAANQEENKTEYACEYCGALADTVDHIPPTSIRPILVQLGIEDQYPFIIVRACHECNGALSDLAYWNVEQRKTYVATWLRRRYRKYLVMPEWTSAELLTLEHGLRQMTIHGLNVKSVVLKRLERADSNSVTSFNDPAILRADGTLPTIRCKTCNKKNLDQEGFCSDLCEFIATGRQTRRKPFKKSTLKQVLRKLSIQRRRELKMDRLNAGIIDMYEKSR